jgi:myo-inositol-1(or 4)-monophosphatase
LIRDGEPILGVISLPALGQRYHATLGGGAWMGRHRLHVSKTAKLQDATGLLCYGYDDCSKHGVLKAVVSLSPASRNTRRIGAATLEAAWVASGHADYAVMHGIRPWDAAAGALLVREAGGLALTPSGKQWRLGNNDLVCTTPGLRAAVLKHLV